MALPMIHFSFPIDDVGHARRFYGEVLGCPEGRQADGRVDFDFFGHHLVGHVPAEPIEPGDGPKIQGFGTPIRHFGLIVGLDEFDDIVGRLSRADWPFLARPKTTNPGTIREHRVAVVRDSCGNVLEFKGFGDTRNIFQD